MRNPNKRNSLNNSIDKCKAIMSEFYNINYVTSISWFLDLEIGKNFSIHNIFCFRNFGPFLLVTLATATYNCPWLKKGFGKYTI